MEIGKLKAPHGGLKVHRSANGAVFGSMAPGDFIYIDTRRKTDTVTWVHGTIKRLGIADRDGWVAEKFLDIVFIPDVEPPEPIPLPDTWPHDDEPAKPRLWPWVVAAAVAFAGFVAAIFGFKS